MVICGHNAREGEREGERVLHCVLPPNTIPPNDRVSACQCPSVATDSEFPKDPNSAYHRSRHRVPSTWVAGRICTCRARRQPTSTVTIYLLFTYDMPREDSEEERTHSLPHQCPGGQGAFGSTRALGYCKRAKPDALSLQCPCAPSSRAFPLRVLSHRARLCKRAT
jgi:hypothetical protein